MHEKFHGHYTERLKNVVIRTLQASRGRRVEPPGGKGTNRRYKNKQQQYNHGKGRNLNNCNHRSNLYSKRHHARKYIYIRVLFVARADFTFYDTAVQLSSPRRDVTRIKLVESLHRVGWKKGLGRVFDDDVNTIDEKQISSIHGDVYRRITQ